MNYDPTKEYHNDQKYVCFTEEEYRMREQARDERLGLYWFGVIGVIAGLALYIMLM